MHCEREAWRVDTADDINIQNAIQPYAGGVCPQSRLNNDANILSKWFNHYYHMYIQLKTSLQEGIEEAKAFVSLRNHKLDMHAELLNIAS